MKMFKLTHFLNEFNRVTLMKSIGYTRRDVFYYNSVMESQLQPRYI